MNEMQFKANSIPDKAKAIQGAEYLAQVKIALSFWVNEESLAQKSKKEWLT